MLPIRSNIDRMLRALASVAMGTCLRPGFSVSLKKQWGHVRSDCAHRFQSTADRQALTLNSDCQGRIFLNCCFLQCS